jgi:hypothetical protein
LPRTFSSLGRSLHVFKDTFAVSLKTSKVCSALERGKHNESVRPATLPKKLGASRPSMQHSRSNDIADKRKRLAELKLRKEILDIQVKIDHVKSFRKPVVASVRMRVPEFI